MKLAIMQPYFFPYLGYYQLANCVDEFIFYDDVNFIKKGFIQRNNILLNKEKFQFSLAVIKASQNRKINEHLYRGEFETFLKQVKSAYKNSPFFEDVYPIIEFVCADTNENVAEKNALGIRVVFDYLTIPFAYSFSSQLNISDDIRAQNRIISVCNKKSASHYINASGGKELYESNKFSAENIKLSFLQAELTEYAQASSEFVAGLSIIDILMNCDKETITEMIDGGRFE